jgi:sugar phosphate isomerase/epimerase
MKETNDRFSASSNLEGANNHSRRRFLKTAGVFTATTLASRLASAGFTMSAKVPVYAHLWVYASKYPPDWDCTPILDTVFSDLKYAGLQGVEIMEIILRHEGSVPRLKELIQKYSLPVSGTSYNGDMWNRSKHQEILEDVDHVLEKLHAVGGTTFGITVGDARHRKTEEELDAQAELLKKILPVCKKYQIEPNLHNHTFEVVDGMHDLKGTLARIPDIKLGPDLNWLIRGGVDPVWFIKTYGHQMVYMHIRDQDAQGKWTEALGEGVTDFKAVANALKEINYKGKAAIELAFDKPPTHPVRDDWKKSREYVKDVFGW